MPEIREGPTPFWERRGGGGGKRRQAGGKQRQAGGRRRQQERERERKRERQIGQGVPQGGGRPCKKKKTRCRWAHESPFGGLLCPKEPIGSEAKHRKCVAICSQAQVDNISYAAASTPHSCTQETWPDRWPRPGLPNSFLTSLAATRGRPDLTGGLDQVSRVLLAALFICSSSAHPGDLT